MKHNDRSFRYSTKICTMRNLFLAIALLIVNGLSAQVLVDTTPSFKNVLLEAHTGVDCPSCPQGTQTINNVLNAHPNRIVAVQMHAFQTGHTTPISSSDEDLRRHHPDLVRQYMTDAQGIPSVMVSRRYFQGQRTFQLFSTYLLDSIAQQVLIENTPINIGLEALYDTNIQKLTVNVGLFATSAALGDYRLNVYLMQNNVVTTQNVYGNNTPGYVHKRVFREVLTPTWGEAFASNLVDNTSYSDQYIYDNDSLTSLYKMNDMEVVVFVTEHSSSSDPMGEVIHVMKAPVQSVSSVITGVQSQENNTNLLEVFPNPSYDRECWIKLKQSFDDEVIYFRDMQGKVVYQENIGRVYAAYIDHQLPAGIYFVSLKSAPQLVKRLVVH